MLLFRKVNGFPMDKLISRSLVFLIVTNFTLVLTSSSTSSLASSLSSSTSSASTSSLSTLSSTSTVKTTDPEFVRGETKDSEYKNDLLKDLKDFGPDDLAKLIKAKKEKELDEFKAKITNIRGNREIMDHYQAQNQVKQQKGVSPIVQQHEDDYQSQGDSEDNSDEFEGGNDSTSAYGGEGKSNAKKPNKFGGLGSLVSPFLPNPGSVMTMMVKPIDHPEQMVCDCYNPGKTSQPQQQQQQVQLTQQQIWPPIAANRKVPMMPSVTPMAPIMPMQPPIGLFPPSPFAFIGQHFANKPRPSYKKKQLNPLSLLIMGLTGNKRKRSRPRPSAVYPSYPPYQQQQQPLEPVIPGFEPELMYPVQQIYNTKGGGGGGDGGVKSKGTKGRKGRKRPRHPSYNLPPPPSSVKGRTKGKTSDKGKWHWTSEDYKDPQQGFSEAK